MYTEHDRGRIRVAHYEPDKYTPAEVAEIFTELIVANLTDGAAIATIEAWAIEAGHYARLAMAERDDEPDLLHRFAAFTAQTYGVPTAHAPHCPCQACADAALTTYLDARQPTLEPVEALLSAEKE